MREETKKRLLKLFKSESHYRITERARRSLYDVLQSVSIFSFVNFLWQSWRQNQLELAKLEQRRILSQQCTCFDGATEKDGKRGELIRVFAASPANGLRRLRVRAANSAPKLICMRTCATPAASIAVAIIPGLGPDSSLNDSSLPYRSQRTEKVLSFERIRRSPRIT